MKGYFVKPANDAVKYFRCDLNGISYGSCTNAKPEFYELLEEEGKQDFDIITDNKNEFHLVCRNNNGDIIYFNCRDNVWTRKTIMKSRYPAKYPKKLRIANCSGILSIFYIIEKDGRKMMVHQFLKEDSPPVVLGYSNGVFDMTTDGFNNIYLAMYNAESKMPVVYRYIWAEKKWSIFKAISDTGEIEDVCIMTDNKDNLYIALCEKEKIYIYKDKKIFVGHGKEPAIVIGDKIYIMFSGPAKDKVYAYALTHNGLEKSAVYSSDGYRKNELFYVSLSGNKYNIRVKKCYGNYSYKGFELYKLDGFFNTDKNVEKGGFNDDNEYIANSYIQSEKNLMKLKEQMEDIKSKINAIQDAVNYIKSINSQK